MTTTFEIGSLAFFRSATHQEMMKQSGEQSGEPEVEVEVDVVDFSPIENIPMRTLSASMFLPKQSVVNFRREIRRRASTPHPTSIPRTRFDHTNRRFRSRKVSFWEPSYPQREKVAHAMKEQFALWDTISKDLCRQGTGPTLMSGNTVINERNFAMMSTSTP